MFDYVSAASFARGCRYIFRRGTAWIGDADFARLGVRQPPDVSFNQI